MTRERVAVIGAGISGLTAAYLLRHRYDVLLLDAEPKLGGHADTENVVTPDGTVVPVDTGFIVHNGSTYPRLTRLFAELDVPTRDTEMSMSIQCQGCGLQYAGGKGGIGLLPSGGRSVRGRYLRMLTEIPRFHQAALRLLAGSDVDVTLGHVLARGGFSRYFIDHFAVPVVSAVWSAGEQISLRYPAHHLFTFLRNHGMLSTHGSLRWRTVVGGSRTYVNRIAARLTTVRTGTPVRAVLRHADGVEVVDATGTTHEVGRVVLATHADQALAALADPTPDEKQVLGAFEYARNEIWLHTDPALLPSTPRIRASWNYLKPACRSDESVLVSYDLNRLMQLTEPVDYIVTLNAASRIDAQSLIKKVVYDHPIFTGTAVAAQRCLPRLTGPRTAYAGAYHGWGFHEDGCVSGVRAAQAFGVRW
jgi:uncharacterized protein